jgi:hypothetical protein
MFKKVSSILLIMIFLLVTIGVVLEIQDAVK